MIETKILRMKYTVSDQSTETASIYAKEDEKFAKT